MVENGEVLLIGGEVNKTSTTIIEVVGKYGDDFESC